MDLIETTLNYSLIPEKITSILFITHLNILHLDAATSKEN